MEITVLGPLSGQPTEELARRVRLLLVIDEVRAGRFTRAAAARALDMTLHEFVVVARPHGLYAIDHYVEDFKREFRAIPKGQRCVHR